MTRLNLDGEELLSFSSIGQAPLPIPGVYEYQRDFRYPKYASLLLAELISRQCAPVKKRSCDINGISAASLRLSIYQA